MKFILIIVFLVSSGINAKDEETELKGSVVYKMKNFNLSSGGGLLESGNFKLTSSIGQLDASNDMVSGNYKLHGGFLHQNRTTDVIFKNGFQ
jgi:hypothetical protein